MDVRVEKEKLRKTPNVCFEKLGRERNLLFEMGIGGRNSLHVGGGDKALATWRLRGPMRHGSGVLARGSGAQREAEWNLGPLAYG